MSTTALDLRGRVAVISGAGSGIGEGLARHAAEHLGMLVVVTDVDEARADAVAAAITAAGGAAIARRVDVTDPADVKAMAGEVVGEHRAPALLVCNAGIEQTGRVWETDPAQWARVQDVNVNGAFALMRAFLPSMIEDGRRGHVLCTSSVGGISIGSDQAAYLVSKHAIRVLAQSLAADLEAASADIGVSVLLPGAVRTRIFEDAATTGTKASEEFRQALLTHLAEDGLTPAEVAALTFEALLAGRFWIHSHPEMSRQVLTGHTADLLGGLPPTV